MVLEEKQLVWLTVHHIQISSHKIYQGYSSSLVGGGRISGMKLAFGMEKTLGLR